MGSPDLWARLCARLAVRIGYDRYNAAGALWRPVRLDSEEILLAVASPGEVERVRRLVGPHLTACARELTNRKTRVIFSVDDEVRRPPRPEPAEPRDDGRLPPFVLTPQNRFAWEAAVHLADAPRPLYRMLYVWGPSAAGKTHLLAELDSRLHARGASGRALRLGGAEYARQFLYALRHGTLDGFRRRCRAVDLLLLDGLEGLAAKERTQAEFLHTLSAITESGGRVAITAQPPPSALGGLRPGLRSRLRGGLVVAMDPPGPEARLEILRAWASPACPAEVLGSLAREHPGNLREAIACLRGLLRGGAPTAEEARAAIAQDRLRHAARLTLEEIVQVTAQEFGVPMVQIYARTRLRRVADARIVCFYLARQLLGSPFEAIGQGIGRRGHVAALQAHRKVAAGRAPTLRRVADRIEGALTAGATRTR